MRLSGDGQNWTPWEAYATERLWTIPAISRQWWPVYLQVRDGVDLESTVISRTVYLDVNPQQPRSTSFRLFDHVLSAGAEAYTSTAYVGHGTLGQIVDSAWITSTNYSLVGGYEAGSQAIPITEPGHDEYEFINGIFASSTGATTMTSTLYLMQGTLGEIGLPNNTTVVTSAGFSHQPGFLAAVPPLSIPAPSPTPASGPPPAPESIPACEFPSITINTASVFTQDPDVNLSICAPRAVEMMISNDGGFAGAVWEPYFESKPWTLTTYGQYVLPRFVYIAFRDAAGVIYSTYFDDIILDPNPPNGTISTSDIPSGASLGASVGYDAVSHTVLRSPVTDAVQFATIESSGAIDLYLNAQDDNSGLAEMQFSSSPDFSNATWEPYSALKPWATGGDGLKTVYTRFRDNASNVSEIESTTFMLDTSPPTGSIAIDRSVVGPKVITVTLSLQAADNLSGVTDMRISNDPNFPNASWQAYTSMLIWPASQTELSQETLYVQYRDLAGNVSQIYSDTYMLDNTPPKVFLNVAPGNTLTRTVTLTATDTLAEVVRIYVSNDPRMIEGVIKLPYTTTLTWGFDARRVIWVRLEDSVGNISEPRAAYAAAANNKIYLPLIRK